MTHEEATRGLQEATQAIAFAHAIIKPHADFFRRYEAEARDMDNFGHIVDPTLFKSSERRAVDAVVGPLYQAALAFVEAVDIQNARAQQALDQVRK